MIKHQKTKSERKQIKAVGLISGGLDSTLAAKIVTDLGVEVYGVYFAMPWGCCDKAHAIETAENLGIKFITLQLDERYLQIVKNPKFGRGTALNPCVDCRIHMFSRAAKYMHQIGAEFVFTGEVIGQRLMSQLRHSMRAIEKNAGLEGRLLRPLCAQHLEPTIPEKEGLIERDKLLDIIGRSRKKQLALAESYKITSYSAPAGGCLLTDRNFARRMEDTFEHGYRNFRETIALKWGRHFRIDKNFKAIIGRDQSENDSLIQYAHTDDHIMQLVDNRGPTLVLKGYHPTKEILKISSGLIQRFSRYKDKRPQEFRYWPVNNKNDMKYIKGITLEEKLVEEMFI